jgi:DNA-directed RNA polymerase specialized sigma24 family protein
MQSKTSEDLMELYQQGNEDAFTTLYQRHVGQTTTIVTNVLSRWDTRLRSHVPDVVREVWSDIHSYASSFPRDAYFAAWLLVAARTIAKEVIQCR